jgi:hypothetical protein
MLCVLKLICYVFSKEVESRLTGMETKTLQQKLQFFAIDEKPKIVPEENWT